MEAFTHLFHQEKRWLRSDFQEVTSFQSGNTKIGLIQSVNHLTQSQRARATPLVYPHFCITLSMLFLVPFLAFSLLFPLFSNISYSVCVWRTCAMTASKTFRDSGIELVRPTLPECFLKPCLSTTFFSDAGIFGNWTAISDAALAMSVWSRFVVAARRVDSVSFA